MVGSKKVIPPKNANIAHKRRTTEAPEANL